MSKYYIEFGVTVYQTEVIEAPNIGVANDIADSLDCNAKFLYNRLRQSWIENISTLDDDCMEYIDVRSGLLSNDAEVTMDAEALGEYLSPIEQYDYHKARLMPEIEQATNDGDWLRVAELASELVKNDPRKKVAHE